MDGLSPWHLIIVAAVGLVVFFGWRQLPEMSRSLGRSLRIFKTEMKEQTANADSIVAAAGQARAGLVDDVSFAAPSAEKEKTDSEAA